MEKDPAKCQGSSILDDFGRIVPFTAVEDDHVVGNNDCSEGDKGNVIEQIQLGKADSVDVLIEEVSPVQFQPATVDDGDDHSAQSTGNEDNHIKSAEAGDADDSAKDIRNRDEESVLSAANVNNLKKGNSQDAVERLRKKSKVKKRKMRSSYNLKRLKDRDQKRKTYYIKKAMRNFQGNKEHLTQVVQEEKSQKVSKPEKEVKKGSRESLRVKRARDPDIPVDFISVVPAIQSRTMSQHKAKSDVNVEPSVQKQPKLKPRNCDVNVEPSVQKRPKLKPRNCDVNVEPSVQKRPQLKLKDKRKPKVYENERRESHRLKAFERKQEKHRFKQLKKETKARKKAFKKAEMEERKQRVFDRGQRGFEKQCREIYTRKKREERQFLSFGEIETMSDYSDDDDDNLVTCVGYGEDHAQEARTSAFIETQPESEKESFLVVKETKEFVESILHERTIKKLPKCFTNLPGAADAMREYVFKDLNREIKQLCSSRHPSVLRDPVLHLESLYYYLNKVTTEWKEHAPLLLRFLQTVSGCSEDNIPSVVLAGSSLLYERECLMSLLPQALSLILMKEGAPYRTLLKLNKFKVCVSPATTKRRMKNLQERQSDLLGTNLIPEEPVPVGITALPLELNDLPVEVNKPSLPEVPMEIVHDEDILQDPLNQGEPSCSYAEPFPVSIHFNPSVS